MEKLHELHERGDYDLLVLDTPPTRNALDFLDAPRKLAAFIDSPSLAMFTGRGLLGLRALGRGTGLLFSVMKRATGIDLLADLSEFFRSFGGMASGFRERAARVNELLADSRTGFVLVDLAAPRRDRRGRILPPPPARSRPCRSRGVVANRVHPRRPRARRDAGGGAGGARRRSPRAQGDPHLGRRSGLGPCATARTSPVWPTGSGTCRIIEVPHLDDDVHDLVGLARMNAHLFAEDGRLRRARSSRAGPRKR